jgi:hypothetical protein
VGHIVPSQARDVIRKLFPDLDKEQAKRGEIGFYRAGFVRAVLDLIARIPEELIRLPPEESALFWANVSALRDAWEDRKADQVSVIPLPPCAQRSILEIRRYLERCPDEAPAPQTTGLQFVGDIAFRETLRTDISSADSALMNHEYKAATVLAGSVVEALLLWALDAHGVSKVQATAKGISSAPLNNWTLGDMIKAAHACNLIANDTKTQAELAQNFRNLIHPGRQARLQDACDRGTALGALAAIERIAADLVKKFP